MTLAAWQATIVNGLGDVQASASVEVKLEQSGALAALFSDRAGATPASNPIAADGNGFVRFYTAGGALRITATKGAFSREWRHVPVGMLGELDEVDSATITYDDTTAEIAASVTVVNAETPNHEASGEVIVTRYGTNTTPGTTDMRAAIAAALSVAAQISGKPVVRIPGDKGTFLVDTSGGESGALTVGSNTHVIIDAEVKASYGAVEANPATIFLVSGDNVTFSGSGQLTGDGTTDDVNSGTADTFPSLVKVTGDYFTMSGLTINKPHKVGVFLYDCVQGKIQGCNFTGGPVEYDDTAYFGLHINQGSKHIVSGNQFYPDSDGGMYVQCIFSNGTSFCLIDANIAYRPYEKLAYINGTHCTISNNIVVGNTGTIAGTSVTGTVGAAIRHDGASGKITNNQLYYCGAGIASIGGGGCTIEGNTLLAGTTAIAVFDGSGVFDFLSIRNNICVCGELTGHTATNGIYVNPPSGTNFYFDISHNQVKGFAPAAGTGAAGIWIEPDGTDVSERCIVSYNNIGPGSTACRIGIYLGYVQQSLITNNRMRCTVYGIQEDNGIYNRYLNNHVDAGLGAVVGIQGLNAASYGEGNVYDVTLPLVSSVTLTASVSTMTVPSATLTVAANAKALVTPTNAAAAAYVAAHGLYATVSSPNVVLTSGDATNFGGTETFNVHVIQ